MPSSYKKISLILGRRLLIGSISVAGLVFGANADAAQVSCTPDAGFNTCIRFTNAGADQSFVVPVGVTSVNVKLWGAAGGAGTSNSGFGGGGAFATGNLAVTTGNVFTIVVGSPGVYQSTTMTYGGGGAGGNDSSATRYLGASGGGRSAVRDSSDDLIVAGGGGGSAGGTASNATNGYVFSYAGGGDQDALYAAISPGTGTGCAAGAPATSGGNGGARGTGGYQGTNGSEHTGGNGGQADTAYTGAGGGGGGGYIGGGGGQGQKAVNSTACSTVNSAVGQDGSGAGGSSYGAPSVSGYSFVAANRQNVANSGDSQYVAGVGVATRSASDEQGPGLVVVQYNSPNGANTVAVNSICNGDPIIAGSDFTNPAWTKSGDWDSVTANRAYLKNDNGTAYLSQAVSGMTPEALVTFSWRFANGIVSTGAAGNQASLQLSYNGIVYWQGLTSDGSGNALASSAQNGATCVSGCGPLAPNTNSVMKIRLPANVAASGTLQFKAQEYGGTSDDPQVIGPVSVANTGICLVKNSRGGVGQFNFTTTGVDTTMGSGGTTASITTTTAGTPIYYDASSTRTNNQPLLVKNPGSSANVTISETPATGFVLDSVDCTGVTPVRSGNSVTIASVPRYTMATCTFTNRTAVINLSKALGGYRYAPSDQFSVAIRTGGVSGTVENLPTASTTQGSGSTVTPNTGTTGDFYTALNTSYTLTEAAESGASLANYNAKLTCTDAAGVTPAASLPNNEAFNPAVGRSITPLVGANLRCVITNTPKNAYISLQKALGQAGRVNSNDQFTLSGTGAGASAAITTTGSGSAITSTPYGFSATAGVTYTLNEAMAAGSGSTLSQYNQTVSCSNTGPTNVSGLTALPITVTPVAGDAITCTVTNTAKGSDGSGGTGGSAICNGNPIIASNDFTDPAWSRTGNWYIVLPTQVRMDDDSGDASMSQAVYGVTPGALLTFSWSFIEGLVGTSPSGNRAQVYLYYTTGSSVLTLWSAQTTQGGGNSPASVPGTGVTCVSGCGPLAGGTTRTVQLRLPATLPINGLLQFRMRTTGGPSDDPAIRTPVTIQNTGICLVKNSVGGVGQFNFTTTGVDATMGYGGTTAAITTTAANAPVYYDASSTRTDNQPLLVKQPGASANVTITENPAQGFVLQNVSCTGGLTPVKTGNSITIANVPQDTIATCTFNNATSTINLSKALGGSRFSANDNFTVAIRTGGVNGTVVNATTNATTTGSGATVDPGTGTTGNFNAAPGTVYTLTEAATSGTDLSKYDAKLSCTDSAGVTPAANLPTNETFNPATGRDIAPLAGANLQCVITNTPKGNNVTLTGRVFVDNGAGGGIAHNGVVDGAEAGLSGITVRAMNGATVLASAVTDVDGNFLLLLTPGTPVDIVVTPPSGYLSVSENVGNTGASNPSVTDSKISFTPASGSSYSGVLFGEVQPPSFAPDQTRVVTPGSTVFLPHIFTAHSSGTVDFSVINAAASPNIPGWSAQLFNDSNCNGSFDAGEPAVSGALAVSNGSQICLLLRVVAPSGAPMNAQYQANVQAVMHYSNTALTSTLLVTDTVTVAESSTVTLVKKVNATQALPGDVLTYTLIYKNASSAPVTNLEINDATPPYTTYVGSSALCVLPLPAAMASCVVSNQPADGNTGAIQWTLSGNLQPGSEGQVKFSVKVRQ